MDTIKLQVIHKHNPPICFSDKSPSSGRCQYKGMHNNNTIFTCTMLNMKTTINIIVASMMFTHSGLKLIDKLFCTMCVVICLPEDGDLSLRHVGGQCLWITYNFIVCVC